MPEDNTVTPSIPPVNPAAVAAEPSAEAGVASEASATPEVSSVPEPSAPADSVVVDPVTAPVTEEVSEDGGKDIYSEVAGKIREAKNVLIALSSDPSVDEMAAAIGLSLYLDKLGKRATAIYSGATPNALEFLKPEETFEPTADTLQDFVIALSKDKADHLRYKLDGDYVKIYITPYKARISEEDLDFSYGDFNVDLVLALDVANGIDLDAALREHGRIMHDAVIVNVTTGNPGKFGEIEWSDKNASSVSEMIARLLYSVSGAEVGKEEATAFLTGIVAATNRFSNAGTTSETMQVASKLMESGANQQLVSKNITPDIENEMFSLTKAEPAEGGLDPTNLEIEHGGEVEGEKSEEGVDEIKIENTAEVESPVEAENKEEEVKTESESAKEIDAQINEKENTLLNDLKEAEESLSHAGAEAVPEAEKTSVKIDSENGTSNIDEAAEAAGEALAPASEKEALAPVQEKVLQPSGDFGSAPMTMENENKYGKMLEDALENAGSTEVVPEAPIASAPVDNPAAMNAPAVPENPEVNGVPEMNYMPMPGEEILPPPPTPPIDMAGAMPASEPVATPVEPAAPAMPVEPAVPIEPAAPVIEPEPTPLGEQPAMQDQVYGPQTADPGAFKIPGM